MLLYSLINIIIVVKYFVIWSGCLVIFRKSTLFFLDFTCLLQKRLLSVLCLVFFRSLQIGYRLMVFNATFNNISVLLVEKTWRKSPTCRKSLTNFITQYCIKYISPWTGFELTNSLLIRYDHFGIKFIIYITCLTCQCQSFWYYTIIVFC